MRSRHYAGRSLDKSITHICRTLHFLFMLCTSVTLAAAARTQRQQLRVLAIGDSITEGAVPSKGYNHPYTIELQKQLEESLKGSRVSVQNEGVGGAGIFAVGFNKQTTIPPVAQAAIQAASSQGKPYSYVVVMLGINDLLREGRSAEDIKGGLQQIYDMALAAGSTVIAIPPFAAPGFVSKDDSKEGQRKQLAGLVKGMAAAQSSKRRSPKIIALDLQADRMEFYSMDTAERARYLDDGLHFTEMGYNILGRHIARAIIRDMGLQPQ